MTALAHLLADQLRSGGTMPFSRFMAAALYHPDHGYYAASRLRTGRAGDFFTSVSVGRVFGQLMAGEFCEAWERMGKPDRFTLIEAGANDGRFACDVLSWIRDHRPDFATVLHYQIDEPLPSSVARQQETLAEFRNQVSHGGEAGRLPQGCYFANELLDAIPCRRVRFRGGRWHELHVGLNPDGGFHWVERDPEDTALRLRLGWLGADFPEDYTTEIAPEVTSHLHFAAGRIEQGYLYFADYGFPAAEYYAPSRTTGTLRCYRDHQSYEDPFEAVGETDLTAHVDFSLAAMAGLAAGCEVLAFLDQARFLTAAAAPALREMEQSAPLAGSGWQRQFQTLTHPAHLGSRFHFLVLGKNVTGLPRPTSLAFARRQAVEDLLAPVFIPGGGFF